MAYKIAESRKPKTDFREAKMGCCPRRWVLFVQDRVGQVNPASLFGGYRVLEAIVTSPQSEMKVVEWKVDSSSKP